MNIITTDKTWLRHLDPETKDQSKIWKTVAEPRAKKARVLNEIYVHIYYGHSPHDSSTSGARRKNDQRKVLQQCTTIS